MTTVSDYDYDYSDFEDDVNVADSKLDLKSRTIDHVSVRDWIHNYKTHPEQRDTITHAAYAVKNHLKEYFTTHKDVHAALYNGVLYKTDGHTRAYLWSRRRLLRPPHVTITLYECNTYEELKSLYKVKDNKKAAETNEDLVYSKCRGQDFLPQSTLVRKSGLCNVHTILSFRATAFDLESYVTTTVNVLRKIDALMLSKSKFSNGAYAAMIMTFAASKDQKDDAKAGFFWTSIANGGGTKNERGMDGIQAAREALYSKELKVKESHRNMCGILLTCYKNYERGLYVKKALKAKNCYDPCQFAREFIKNYEAYGVKPQHEEEDDKKVKTRATPARNGLVTAPTAKQKRQNLVIGLD